VTAGYTAIAVLLAGATPVFADVDPETLNIDPASCEAAITPRTVAIVPVHLYGQPADMPALTAIAARRSLAIVEDCCQAHFATCAGTPVGTLGAGGAFSFYPTKNLGGRGDGGAVVSNDSSIAARVRRLRNGGQINRYIHGDAGVNSRLDELQAAVLNVKLAHLESWSEARRRRAAAYEALIAEAGLASRGLVHPPVRRTDRTHIYHQYVVRVPGEVRPGLRSRDGLRDHLTRAGIGSGIYYPVPLHLQECFRPLGHARGDFPVSERAADEVLALPIYPELTDAQQQLVVKEMAGFFGHA
jgi:dTDP-4-amino-4,6-dideoxygalactose transaminase